ncbi:MAG: 2-oxo acid dehydrogenase subunit E2 [Halobacteriales archaeon]|nr:2-oxo acid dehydrogenase subunit E2 [Halobacteriales archaeon]
MVYEFKLPDVGDGTDEAELLKWMVSEGDGVLEDDPVAEVETERAIIEIPSPVSGKVLELNAGEGETVSVGTSIAVFDTEEDGEENREEGGVEILDDDGNTAVDVDTGTAPEYPEEDEDEEQFASPSTRLLAHEVGVDIEKVEGSGADGRIVAQDVLRAAKERQEEREAENGRGSELTTKEDDDNGFGFEDAPTTGEDEGMSEDDVSHDFAQDETPAVDPETAEDTTMFAEEPSDIEKGIEFGDEPETSETPEADFEYDDKEESVDVPTEETTTEDDGIFAKETDESTKEGESVEHGFETTDEDTEDAEDEPDYGDTHTEPETVEEAETTFTETAGITYTGQRKRVGEALQRTADAPLATVQDTADAERLVEVRERLRGEVSTRLTYTSFLVKACGVALQDHRVLDSELDEDAGKIRLRDGVDIRVATETDDGVRFPVVEKVDEKGVAEIAGEIDALVETARDDDLEKDDGEQGGFTVYNVGAVGGEGTTVLPYPPGTTALGVGEIRERPYVVDGNVVARHTVTLSLTFDSRVADTAVAARFTNDLKRYLNDPMEMLL